MSHKKDAKLIWVKAKDLIKFLHNGAHFHVARQVAIQMRNESIKNLVVISYLGP